MSWPKGESCGTKQTAINQGVLMAFTSTPMPMLMVTPGGDGDWTGLFLKGADGRVPQPLLDAFAPFQSELRVFSAECDAFGATAAAHATRLANATAGRPACYDALAVLYCAQEPVLSAASSCVEGAAGSSARTCSSSDYSSCSSHGREYTRGVHDCTLFCPAVAEACDGVASSLADCEAWCHALHVRASYCEVLRVSGVADALGVDWDVEVRDINNRYRLVKEVGTPVLIEGRPQYLSLIHISEPTRRRGGS